MSEDSDYRVQLWDYYDRRVEFRAQNAARGQDDESRQVRNALEYWHGLGVAASASELEAEDAHVRGVLNSLESTTYLEVGSGPGTYTSILPGKGIALDQSAAALRVLVSRLSGISAIRADALQLPLRDRSVGRVFAADIYGILAEPDRTTLLQEARRVGFRLWSSMLGAPPACPLKNGNNAPLGLTDSSTEFSDGISTHMSSPTRSVERFYSQAASTSWSSRRPKTTCLVALRPQRVPHTAGYACYQIATPFGMHPEQTQLSVSKKPT